MNILIGSVLLAAVALWLWRKLPNEVARQQARQDAVNLAYFIFPRITVALIGAALFADLLPEDMVRDTFGNSAGWRAIALAIVIGPITPGGPFVCFAIAAAGLQVGASEAAVAGYVTSWLLFSLTKSLAYEWPLIGARFLLQRVVISLPVPLLVTGLFWALTI